MEIINIQNIAANNGVPWSTLAEAIDNNFEVLRVNKADYTAHTTDIEAINTAITNVNTELDSVSEYVANRFDDLDTDVNTLVDVALTNAAFNKYEGEYTYAELLLLADGNGLIPGNTYVLSDYICNYLFDNETVYSSTDGWKLILVACSTNEFFADCKVQYATDSTYATKGGIPIINCKYRLRKVTEVNDITYEWEAPESKGVIYYMEDANHNVCNYDFKHIRFKRGRITDITPNTTVDSKANGTYGCYRTYLTDDDNNTVNDERTWVGSGANLEKQLLTNIFNGDFRSVEWGQTAYHPDFVNEFVKPYANASDASKSYLLFWSDNDVNRPTWWAYQDNDSTKDSIYKVNYTTTGEYNWYYTFDCNGEDYSNNSNCFKNRIMGPLTRLSNTTIQVFSDNVDICYNTFNYCIDNTVQLISINSAAQMAYCMCDRFCGNMLISRFIYNINCTHFRYNLGLRLDISNFLGNNVYSNVLIGGFNGVNFTACSNNILFGDPRVVKLAGSDSYVSPADGNYWYDDVADEWFGYNIMAPFLYSHFFPHTNTNTVLMPYNKGAIFNGTIQHNFFYRLRWGVKFEYGCCLYQYFGNELNGVTINASAFSDGNHNQKVNESNPYPLLGSVDIKAYQQDRHSFVPSLTEGLRTTLANRAIPCMWVISGNINKIIKYSDL